MESNSILLVSFINFIHDLFFTFSSFCSHPLFSTLVTLYTLILLYAPSFFLRVALSPVLNSTGIILVFLLKLGANERSRNDLSSQEIIILGSSAKGRLENESNYLEARVLNHKDGGNFTLCSSSFLESTSLEQRFVEFLDHNQNNIKFEVKEELGFGSNQMDVEFEHDLGLESNFQDDCNKRELLDINSMKSSQEDKKEETRMEMEMDLIQVDTAMKFLEWNMKAPLEIIYEAYEGEEEDDDDDNNANNMYSSDNKYVRGCERYPSLSMYYPESETDSSSDDDFTLHEKWETHESGFLKWKTEDDERDELIEISLDHCGKRSVEFCQDDEDSLIEIDISPQETEY